MVAGALSTSYYRHVCDLVHISDDSRPGAPMTWINTVPYEQADPELRRVYEAVRALYPAEYRDPVTSLVRPDGGTDSITAAHSLIPEAMWHMMAGLGVVLRPGLGLSRKQQEMIASVVSARNGCFY